MHLKWNLDKNLERLDLEFKFWSRRDLLDMQHTIHAVNRRSSTYWQCSFQMLHLAKTIAPDTGRTPFITRTKTEIKPQTSNTTAGLVSMRSRIGSKSEPLIALSRISWPGAPAKWHADRCQSEHYKATTLQSDTINAGKLDGAVLPGSQHWVLLSE